MRKVKPNDGGWGSLIMIFLVGGSAFIETFRGLSIYLSADDAAQQTVGALGFGFGVLTFAVLSVPVLMTEHLKDMTKDSTSKNPKP